jgi:hypothetical protein
MTLDRSLRLEATRLTAQDDTAVRTLMDEDRLLTGFVAEFVAQSESLEGHDSKASDVLDSMRDLVLKV